MRVKVSMMSDRTQAVGDQRWPESLFQTPIPLLFQNLKIRIRVRIRKFFKFENATPLQTPAAIDPTGNLPEMSTDQDWIGLNFLENWRSRTESDWENFCCFNV